MRQSERTLQEEFEEWKRSLPVPTSGPKAMAARQLRDNLRVFTFGFRAWLEEAMRPEGMTVAQLRMLFTVQHEGDASSARIARLCQVTPQTMQAMLQRAIREGWLRRRPAPHNARVLISTLTRKGEALLQQAMDRTAEFERQAWKDATVAELEAMNAAFAKALARMEQARSAAAETGATARTPRRRVKARS